MQIAILWSCVLAALLFAAELGWRRGRRDRSRSPIDEQPEAITLQAALLGLLGLLLGFTFSIAAGRFDARKTLIVDEANAIGTARLRVDLLDEPWRSELRGLMRSYVDARLSFYAAGARRDATKAAAAEADVLLGRIWHAVVPAARANASPPLAGLAVAATNEMIDLAEKRNAALEYHVPVAIYALLMAASLLGASLTGYVTGWNRRRWALGTVVFPVIVGALNLLILDLDHPRVGFIRTGQESMVRLRQ